MPTIPPGNKQIGDYVVIATATVDDSIKKLVNWNISSLCLIEDSNNLTQAKAISSVGLGDYSAIAVAINSTNQCKCYNVQVAAVVFYAKPTIYKNCAMLSTALVSDGTTYSLPEPKNTFIGDYTLVATVEQTSDITPVDCYSIQAFAVVQEFVPRNELTIFNIEYAAES